MKLLLTTSLFIAIIVENALLAQNVLSKWAIADKNFFIQMCGDSTISGRVTYDQQFMQRINACHTNGERKLSNGSSPFNLCKHVIFRDEETNPTDFWFDLKCNKSVRGMDRRHFHAECVQILKRHDRNSQQQEEDSYHDRYFANKTDCLLKSRNLNMDQISALRYLQYKYSKLMDFYGDVLCNSTQLTTVKKIDRFESFKKCYQMFSPGCFTQLQVALDIHQYQYYHDGFVSILKQQALYCARRDYIVPNLLITTCESDENPNISIKDYYKNNAQKLDALLSCERNALITTQNTRAWIPTEQSIRQSFDEMMQTEKRLLNRN